MSKRNGHNSNNPFECCYGCVDKYPACSDHCERHAKGREIRAEQRRMESLNGALARAEETRDIRNAKKK